MMAAGRRVALAMRRGTPGWEGVNLFLADGAAAGQTVFHAHLHVIPRSTGDGFGLRRPVLEPPSRAELEEQAAGLRAVLEDTTSAASEPPRRKDS
jgi:diadenosine tetraphosphate (Ap4A) HIT family hydrolase